MSDISAILTVHGEGVMAGLSLHSMKEAAEDAERNGYSVELLVVMDSPDVSTRRAFEGLGDDDVRVLEVQFRDQGQSRNAGVEAAEGKYLAFLDGDDLWSFNWLSEGAKAVTENTVIHPEFNYFFGSSNNIMVKIDDRKDYFDPEFLRVGNYWDALCIAPKEVYQSYPYYDRDIENGFAYEDWHWNCATLEGGIAHHVAQNTIHFKRRRVESQSVHSSNRKAIVKPTKLFRYDWYE